MQSLTPYYSLSSWLTPSVTDLVCSLGSPDAVTDIVKPSQLELLNDFLKRIEVWMADQQHDAARPRQLPQWPVELGYMGGAQLLYSAGKIYLPLVQAYCLAAAEKVARLDHFYRESGENEYGVAQPSDAAIARHSNVATCGGAYYINGGKPTGSVTTQTLDWKEEDMQTDGSCGKQVRVFSLRSVVA